MKKAILLGSMIVFLLLFTGCGKVIELTEEENYLIAEYAAELLLKYDSKLDSKYYESMEATASTTEAIMTYTDATTEELVTTEEVAETVTEEPTPEISTTEEQLPSDADSETNTTEQVSTGNSDSETGGQNVSVERDEQNVVADVDASYDFGPFIGEDNVSIVYSYYMLADHYPSYDKDGVYIEIQAPQGYKLLVLKFDIESKIHEDQYLDLYNKNLEYNIIVNNSKSAKQMLTILIDDLYTYQSTLSASGREEVVLLFQVSDNASKNISDLKLRVKSDGAQKVIQLQ